MKLSTKLRNSGAAALALAVALGAASTAHAATTLVETGSSLLYPLFNLWVPDFTAANPGIQLTTTSTGSGAGIAQSIKGLVQIGASDAYLSDNIVKKNPGMLSIPLAISAQAINFNLPGLNDKNIKLSGPILADIYSGKITMWNDKAIKAANPGVKLPAHVIIPIHRVDGSGDTFIFTQYLSDSTPAWAHTVDYGTAVSWPAVTGGIGANGNSGMVSAAAANPYSIAYIGVSFSDQVAKAGLGVAKLKNADGNYELPTAATVGTAADSIVTQTPPDERISMIFAHGANAYPIANYEYAIINTAQPNAETATAVKTFLNWALTSGNDMKYLSQVHFLPLPAAIVTLSKTQIAKIH
ncbi:phosphate ABC transporter substrate-binding protein PstS [Acidocella sp.]|uniref:phosphate ABC transporter substrate-binding protein PstS n=1 Tax=Acidocella sp. TaxID=50710 RepID=UPI00263694F8|nr:phosphate ABC transporter substrate-binding protein PstS [Acidocella sp.]MDD2795583.1 phosphate ABC transporter substrate-binding protein PstS [Acidocella sp.]